MRCSTTERTTDAGRIHPLQLLKTLENNPSLSQRDLAKRLDISLRQVNFCLNALVARRQPQDNNFRNSDNKLTYAYLLTRMESRKSAHDGAVPQIQGAGI
jgi:hypothetical protein